MTTSVGDIGQSTHTVDKAILYQSGTRLIEGQYSGVNANINDRSPNVILKHLISYHEAGCETNN